MSVSLSVFTEWLKDSSAVRCVLVEAEVKLSGGSTTTRYLSNTGYVTAGADAPANTIYAPVVSGGVKFTESISLDGAFSLSYGDIELNNTDGSLDTWLSDYWANRRIRVWVGDKSWIRDDFYPVFDGIVTGIDSRKRETINLKLSDKLQRLNQPVTEAKLGGSTPNADKLLPICLGECHNVTPLLVNPATHEYMVHNGPVESIIEVRDNGVPVTVTKYPAVGKFKLLTSPSGTITASVQGAITGGANLLTFPTEFDNAAWAKSLINVTANSAYAPDGTSTADTLSSNTTPAIHKVEQTVTVVNGSVYTFVVYAKRSLQNGMFMYAGTTSVNYLVTATPASLAIVGTSTSTTTHLGDNWVRCSMTFTASGTSVVLGIAPAQGIGSGASYPGTNGADLFVWGASFYQGAAPAYVTTVSDIVTTLATDYGKAGLRFTTADLDTTSLATYKAANAQQVGIYISERTNVLEAANRVADSLGSRMRMSKTGLLSLVKLTLPQGSAGNTITSSSMVDRSLYVSTLPPVKASCKIGYNKCWTIQTTVALGVLEEHAALFRDEWLTVTQTDSTAASNFNLFTEPDLEETLLLVPADASAESLRRLNVYNVQRKQLKYKGFGDLMVEVLGNPQTIQHSRYGLSGGVTGQIIGITTDWLNQKAEIEVLI